MSDKNVIFAAKISSMNRKIETTINWAVHAVFCICLILFFGRNCILRQAAFQHIYKEYLSGIAVLFIVYINRLVLFPKLYAKARSLEYILATFFSVLVAFLFEMALVAPEIMDYMHSLYPSHKILTYLTMDGFFVFLRDLSFALASFSLQAFLYYKGLNQNKDSTLLKEFHRLETYSIDKSNKKALVLLGDISYCKQVKNYTRVHLIVGNSLIRYGTLKELTELLNESYAVQVSRSIVIPYSSIVDYNKSGVMVKSTPENIMISYSDIFATHAYELVAKHVRKNEKGVCGTLQKRTAKPRTAKPNKPQQSDILYAFISEHPGCSAAEIKKNRSISLSTVNRILADLKKEGLIEYVGSKKTGGYRTVEKENL